MYRFLTALALGTALMVPLALKADDDDHHRRYYDRQGRDYHEWNEREDRGWQHYREEQHIQQQIDFARARRRQQEAYWRWRHQHPEYDH